MKKTGVVLLCQGLNGIIDISNLSKVPGRELEKLIPFRLFMQKS